MSFDDTATTSEAVHYIATRLRHAQHFSESLESPVQLKGCSDLRLKVSNDNTHTVSRISFGLQNLTGAGLVPD